VKLPNAEAVDQVAGNTQPEVKLLAPPNEVVV
jgi:hypothetical protein